MIGLGSTVGNYRVVKKLGSGAMGSVYLGEHPMIGKKVALKVIHADLAENEEMVSRFFNEARAVTQIGHQNIIEVIDFGQTPEGDNFIVMELLEGRSLGDVIKESTILDVKRVVHIATQMADGLEASHLRGIIHRDLKPDNIYLIERLGDPDFVKILDFGLAKLTQGGGALSHKTRAGSVLGTPHYMAPEQCEGKPDIDHRVDVYALGCLMFQMLCGRVPFPGEGFGEVLVKHLREPPAMPSKLNPAVPRPIEAIILNALAKRKEFRFQSMREMSKALRDPDRYLRELAGEGPIMPLTGEMPLPAQVAAIASAMQPRPQSLPTTQRPVVKATDVAPTMLDEVPPEVAEALAGAGSGAASEPSEASTSTSGYVPPPASAVSSTLLFDGASPPSVIAPTPISTRTPPGSQTVVPPPPDSTVPGVLDAPTPAAMRRAAGSRRGLIAGAVAGVALLLVGGAVVAMRLGRSGDADHARGAGGEANGKIEGTKSGAAMPARTNDGEKIAGAAGSDKRAGSGESNAPNGDKGAGAGDGQKGGGGRGAARKEVVVNSQPAGATVLRDGKSLGPTPLLLELAPGEHARLDVKLDGFQDAAATIADTDESPVTVQLEKKPEAGGTGVPASGGNTARAESPAPEPRPGARKSGGAVARGRKRAGGGAAPASKDDDILIPEF